MTLALTRVEPIAPEPALSVDGPYWHARLGALARTIGSERFHEALLSSFGALLGHDSAWIIRYARHGAPDVRFTRNVPSHVLDIYRSGYDRGDPFLRFWAQSPRQGVVRLGDVLTPENRAYWQGFQLKARIADEMAMIFPMVGHIGLALFLERAEVPFSDADAALARLVFPAFEGFHRAHIGHLFNRLRSGTKAAARDLIRQPTLILDRSGATVFVNAPWRHVARDTPAVAEALEALRTSKMRDRPAEPSRVTAGLQIRVELFDRDFPLAPGGRMFVLEPPTSETGIVGRLDAALGRLPCGTAVTPRERDILTLTMGGKTTGEIAQELAISKGTIKNHRLRLYRKLGVSSERAMMSLLVSVLQEAAGAGPAVRA